ncbi:MAG: biotin/lipoyl-containing protein, partial [Pseudoxanthomonas sp.]
IQIFGDSHGNAIHLNERECSAQRRYQKVLEESPSVFLTPELRAAMGEAAVKAAHAIDYVNAGTVEFIVDPEGAFYFMEINTRLQVEHPVTELTTGLDLVEWQLRIAAGGALPLTQPQVPQKGHAIEVRLYAEDPEAGFLPGSGKLEKLVLPAPSPQVRIDSGVVEGDTVSIFYDPMIAKLIVWDQDRPSALARLREALAQCEIVGPKSNIEFLEQLIRHTSVVEGSIDTGYLDRHLEEFMPAHAVDPSLLLAAATATLLAQENNARESATHSTDTTSPWAIADGWRLGHAGRRPLAFLHRGQDVALLAHGANGEYAIESEEGTRAVSGARLHAGELSLRLDSQARRFQVRIDPRAVTVHDGDRRLHLAVVSAYRPKNATVSGNDGRIVAPMPGRVVVIKARPGDTVSAGQELLVIEAMKMELAIKAPRDGVVAELRAFAGDFVEADAVLATLEPQ